MVELKASLVEQQAAQESTMMSQFAEEKSALNESINELAAQLHIKQAELHSVEQKLVQSTQQFEEQLKRLSEKYECYFIMIYNLYNKYIDLISLIVPKPKRKFSFGRWIKRRLLESKVWNLKIS